ncbi:unnamed protein product, partial [Symbiodinium microadriaticum]
MVQATLRRVTGDADEELIDAALGYIDPTTLVPITWPNRTTLAYTDGGEFGVAVESTAEHVNAGMDDVEGAGGDEPMPDPPEFEAERPAPVSDAVEAPVRPPQPDSVVTVNGVGLSMGSTLGALRAGCQYLGLSRPGYKQRCFQRLQVYVEKERLASEVQVAEQARSGDSREPNMQSMPQPPSEEARLLREITHLPFANWCSHCVAMKSVPDQHRLVPEGLAMNARKRLGFKT